MSITDELREYVRHYSVAGSSKDKTLTAIADRIDAEHERLMQEQPYTIDMVSITDENMAKHGWIRMPLDANGVLILDRDKMAAPNGNVFVVTHMLLQDGEWVIQSWPASCLIHYKTTVENILADMLDEWGELPSDEPAGEIIAKYAAQLQLKEDE